MVKKKQTWRKVTIRLTPDQYEVLRERSYRTRVPIQQIIVRALGLKQAPNGRLRDHAKEAKR